MVQFGCHKHGKFLFLLQVFEPVSAILELPDVASHIRATRKEPLRKEGLTALEAVTNILSQNQQRNL
jgi:hypothetical protein